MGWGCGDIPDTQPLVGARGFLPKIRCGLAECDLQFGGPRNMRWLDGVGTSSVMAEPLSCIKTCGEALGLLGRLRSGTDITNRVK